MEGIKNDRRKVKYHPVGRNERWGMAWRGIHNDNNYNNNKDTTTKI